MADYHENEQVARALMYESKDVLNKCQQRVDAVEDQLYKNSKLKTQLDFELEEIAAKTAELERQKVQITAENLELEKQMEEHRQVRLNKENEVNENLGKLKQKKNTLMQKIKWHEEKLANLNQMKPIQKKTYSKVTTTG